MPKQYEKEKTKPRTGKSCAAVRGRKMRVPSAADGKKSVAERDGPRCKQKHPRRGEEASRFTSEYGKLKKRKSLPEDTQVTKKQ